MVRIFLPCAAILLTLPAAPLVAQEITPEYERTLQCAAAANVSQMILRSDVFPSDPAQRQSNDAVLAAKTLILHRDAPTFGLAVQLVDEEVARRSTIIRNRLNALPDSEYLYALRLHLSFRAGGGMESCADVAGAG